MHNCSSQLQPNNTPPPAALQTNSNHTRNTHSTTLSREQQQQQQQHPHQLSLLASVSAAFHSSSSSSSSSDMPSPPSSALGMQPPPATAAATAAYRPNHHYTHAHADASTHHHSAPTIPSSKSSNISPATLSHASSRHAYHHRHHHHHHTYMAHPSSAAVGIMPLSSSYHDALKERVHQNEIYVAPSQAHSQARFSEQSQQHYPVAAVHQVHQLPSSTVAAAAAAGGGGVVVGPSYEQQHVDHHANHNQQQQQQSGSSVMQQRFITPPTSGSIRATKAQLKVLEKIFLENAMPSGMMHQAISERIGMSKKAVRNWFQNQRAKVRRQEQEERYLRGQHSPIPDSQYHHQYQGGGGGVSSFEYRPMDYSHESHQVSAYPNSMVHSSQFAVPMSGQYHHPHAQHQIQQQPTPLSPPVGPLRPLQWVLDQHERQPKQEHFEKHSAQQQQQYSNESPPAQCIETEEGLGISMESGQKVRRNVMSVEALM